MSFVKTCSKFFLFCRVQLQYFVEMDHMYCANCGVTEAKQVASVGTAFVLFVLVFLKKVFYSIEIVVCDLSWVWQAVLLFSKIAWIATSVYCCFEPKKYKQVSRIRKICNNIMRCIYSFIWNIFWHSRLDASFYKSRNLVFPLYLNDSLLECDVSSKNHLS